MEILPNEMFEEIFKNISSLNDLKKFKTNRYMNVLIDDYIERNKHLIINKISEMADKNIT
jgi:hypothetical protein